ncbi:MAG: leucine-rich repeat domain-containing protein, partial [Planctomycetes bacterium]|nr:leucine-rich repeat domain-containing protein [Planctomycetota bacterium]
DMLQLTGLRCRGSHITRIRGLQHAKNIRTLTLSFNDIESISSLSGLSKLEDLTLNDNQITSISAVGALYELFSLDVHNNQIKSVSALSGMTNLRLLTLRGNQITNISALSDLSLTVLEIEENQISQISALSSLEGLLLLNLSDNDISSIAPLTLLTELQSVDLRGNDLDDQAYDQHLQTILDNNPGVSIRYDPRPSPSVRVQASKGTFSDRVRVTWSRVDNGPSYTSYYRVYRAASVSGPKTAVSAWQRDNVFEDTGVNAGTEYRYWISVAVNEFGENAKMDEASATGWASRTGGAPNTGGTSQPILLLSSTAGGAVNSSYDAANSRLGDIVDIMAEPVDTNLFVFWTWSGTAVEEGRVLDPTDPFVSLELKETQSLKAHFLTTLTTLHVSSDVPARVEPDLPQELGTPLQPFHQIQDAIDVAAQGVTIVVGEGTYAENLRFQGVNVVLTGIDYPVLRDSDGTPLASFVDGEDADCVLNGFVLTLGISDIASAIFCDNSHPTISNCLIVGNRAALSEGPGSAVYLVNSHMTLVNCTIADNICGSLGAGITLVDSDATVTNSIFWNNGPDDLRLEGTSRPRISYSNFSVVPTLTDPSPAGLGNLSVDPRFVRPGQWADPPDQGPVWTAGDYHLRSQSGRWDSDTETWVLDDETSPCVDGGDPAWPVGPSPCQMERG